jgi:L-lactate dehydrogenase complex protein LldG
MTAEARAGLLAAIAQATAGVRAVDPAEDYARLARDYRLSGAADPSSLPDLLAERLADYGVEVMRTTQSGLAAAIRSALAARGARRILVPAGLAGNWLAASADLQLLSADSAPAEMDRADAVLTGCAVAIAETGTIILDGGAGQGRRAITLVPDVHVCVVAASQVVALVPEAVARLADAVQQGRPLTWISGPSATSDIELSRVAGVHGPRTLIVILVGDG